MARRVLDQLHEIEGGVTAPCGFEAAGIRCGLKQHGPDLALLYSVDPATVVGAFTTNRVQAAPVLLCKDLIGRGGPFHGVVVNTGMRQRLHRPRRLSRRGPHQRPRRRRTRRCRRAPCWSARPASSAPACRWIRSKPAFRLAVPALGPTAAPRPRLRSSRRTPCPSKWPWSSSSPAGRCAWAAWPRAPA